MTAVCRIAGGLLSRACRLSRFRLRTLLVLVFVASWPLAWVAYSLNWIRERREAHAVGAVEQDNIVTWRDPPAAPYGLWLFGERALEYLRWWPGTRFSLEDAERLFPESAVCDGTYLNVRPGD